jgi:hypothetical protein
MSDEPEPVVYLDRERIEREIKAERIASAQNIETTLRFLMKQEKPIYREMLAGYIKAVTPVLLDWPSEIAADAERSLAEARALLERAR